MTLDRAQVRRDAEAFLQSVDHDDAAQQWAIMFAERNLALLDELQRDPDAEFIASALPGYDPARGGVTFSQPPTLVREGESWEDLLPPGRS